MSETERLLVEVIDQMALRFENRAVLRGGMVLRVLGCERLTNDVDYLLVPFRSKKDVVEDVLEVLGLIEGVQVTHSLNSKCLRVVLRRGKTVAQVEIKVGETAAVKVMSTKGLAERMGLPPRLIPVLDFPVALADKLAAWNERRLMRDVYDIWFFLRMGVRPDSAHLERRLRKPVYSRLVPPRRRLREPTLSSFQDLLVSEVGTLTEEALAESLRDYLPAEELTGLAMRIRAEIVKAFG
jgi:predicted nucleotidyltransferase component of viral defense system